MRETLYFRVEKRFQTPVHLFLQSAIGAVIGRSINGWCANSLVVDDFLYSFEGGHAYYAVVLLMEDCCGNAHLDRVGHKLVRTREQTWLPFLDRLQVEGALEYREGTVVV